jgi:predicted DNA-binding transcriptional regulator AlpA
MHQLGISSTSLWRLQRLDAHFPQPIQITARRVGFVASEIAAWQESRRRRFGTK